MNIKGVLIVFAVLVGVLAGGITPRLLAQSGRPNPVQTATAQPSQPAAAPTGQTWEYRILYLNGGAPTFVQGLNQGINEAASQGFEVQTLQPVYVQSPPLGVASAPPDLIVLLRRPRK